MSAAKAKRLTGRRLGWFERLPDPVQECVLDQVIVVHEAYIVSARLSYPDDHPAIFEDARGRITVQFDRTTMDPAHALCNRCGAWVDLTEPSRTLPKALGYKSVEAWRQG